MRGGSGISSVTAIGHHVLIALTLVYLMLASAAGVRVVCFGNDGHVRIEEAAVACTDAPGWDQPAATTTVTPGLADTGHCGDCTDVTIASGVTQASLGQWLDNIAAAVVWLFLIPALLALVLPCAPRPSPAYLLDGLGISLRLHRQRQSTVVLLN
jgi:hypothetical protein